MFRKVKYFVTVGSVHSPVPLPNLSIRGWGPKRKKKVGEYSFKVGKVRVMK